jgi:serine/threonine protein kinase
VLYELLAGRSPFEAPNELEMLKKIVHAAPAPLPDGTPDLLRMTVDKALEKEPGDRYQTMQDLAADLRRVARKPASSQTAMTVSSDAQALAGIVKRHRTAAFGAVAALAVAVSALGYLALSRIGEPSRVSSAPAATLGYRITPLTSSGDAGFPAISPDGKYSVYVKGRLPATSLWVRQIETASDRQLVAPETGVVLSLPTISPDGNYVDFLRAAPGTSPSLWRMALLGGTPRRLAQNVSSPVGWSPDGRQMAFLRADAVVGELILADEQGNERVLASLRVPRYFVNMGFVGGPPVWPAWSPDG